jgi:outer membrane protein assembly factor BamE (lipoprotein component of BamABCDE complex)
MNLRSICHAVVIASLALILTGCGSKLNQENLNKVETGMSEKQVQELLGKPTSTETAEAFGLSATTYVYKNGDVEVRVIFANHQVISKTGTFP